MRWLFLGGLTIRTYVRMVENGGGLNVLVTTHRWISMVVRSSLITLLVS